MTLNKTDIEKVLDEMEDIRILEGNYGNGEKAKYKRIIKNSVEYTYVLEDECNKLYVGSQGDTVTRIKEGRREDNLLINGERAKFAKLVAQVEGKSIFFTKTLPITI